MKLVSVECPRGAHQFQPTHEFAQKRKHWDTYGQFVSEACDTLPRRETTLTTKDFVLRFHFEDQPPLSLAVDYADEPDRIADVTADGILKMRWHPGRPLRERPIRGLPQKTAGYREYQTVPIAAAGFGMGFEYSAEQIRALRMRKDTEEQARATLYTGQTFRVLRHPRMMPGSYPNRAKFRKLLHNQPPMMRLPEWLNAIARHRTALNLCGNGNTIDRKVVQMCAIGTAIVSDRGLADLELPWGGTFEHGVNVFFIDEPGDIETAEAMTDADWKQLVHGSRMLYDGCLSPIALGRWYLKKAEEWAQ
jgi:hypothetical protein